MTRNRGEIRQDDSLNRDLSGTDLSGRVGHCSQGSSKIMRSGIHDYNPKNRSYERLSQLEGLKKKAQKELSHQREVYSPVNDKVLRASSDKAIMHKKPPSMASRNLETPLKDEADQAYHSQKSIKKSPAKAKTSGSKHLEL